jgi:hemoglobin/transferrin/lactoferrin receptor protein
MLRELLLRRSHKMKSKSLVLALMFVHFLCSSQNSIDTLILDSNEGNPLIFSASKNYTSYSKIPVQVLKLDKKEIDFLQPSTTADLLQKNGNVFVQKSQMGGGSPIIRGLEANRITLVIDGVRLNNLIYRGGHLQNIITMDPNCIENLEVLYGPSSSLYGSDALGGVIHIQTYQPKFSRESTVHVNTQTRVGSAAQEFSQHFNVALQNNNWSSWTSFTFNQWGDLRSGKNKNWFYKKPVGERNQYLIWNIDRDSIVSNSDNLIQRFSGYKQQDFIQKFAYRKGDQTHQINFQYSNSSNIPRYDRLTDVSNGELKFGEWYYGPQKRNLTSYMFKDQNLPSGIDLNAQFNFQSIEESRYTRKRNSPWLESRLESVNVASTTINLHRANKRNEWNVGIDGQMNTLKSTAQATNKINQEIKPISTRYPDAKNEMNQWSLYGYNVYSYKPNLQIHASGRIGYSSLKSSINSGYSVNGVRNNIQQTQPTYSGGLGWVYNFGDYGITSNITTAYRVPNIDDLSKIFETSTDNVIIPNENLKPEQATTLDFSMRHIANNPKWQWNFNLYNTWLNNFIALAPTQINGADSILFEGSISPIVSAQNQDKGYIRGAQFNMTYNINLHWSADLSANCTKGRFVSNNLESPMDHIPPMMANSGITFIQEKWSTQLNAQFQGWKRLNEYRLGAEDNEVYATPDGTPAFMIFNIRTQYQIANHSQLIAGIDNLLDTQYRLFASGINAPGRNLYLSYKFNF